MTGKRCARFTGFALAGSISCISFRSRRGTDRCVRSLAAVLPSARPCRRKQTRSRVEDRARGRAQTPTTPRRPSHPHQRPIVEHRLWGGQAHERTPRLKPSTMPIKKDELSQRDSNQIASGVTGAVHIATVGINAKQQQLRIAWTGLDPKTACTSFCAPKIAGPQID